MKKLSLLVFAVALQTASTLPALGQKEQMTAGYIRAVKVEGTAWQILQDTGQQERLKEGDFLRQGNTVVTENGSRAVLLFQNGSVINLQPGTKLSIDAFMIDPFDAEKVEYRKFASEPSKSVTKVRLNQGTVNAKVAKLNRASSYNIVTPLGTAGIRGTTVTVSVNEKSMTVVVTEGMVQVTKNGQSFWMGGADQQSGQDGDTRTAREGNQEEQTVVVSSDQNYTPPQADLNQLNQQGKQFGETASQSIPPEPFKGAPAQQTGPGTDGDGGGGGSGGGSGGGAPPLPGGFGGGGGGGGSGGSSGGGSIYGK